VGISFTIRFYSDAPTEIPHNVLVIDTLVLEKNLFASGERGSMLDYSKGKPRVAGSALSLEGLLRSFNIDIPCQLHNSGNDAFMTLFSLQKLFEPDTPLPSVRALAPRSMMGIGNPMLHSSMMGVPMGFTGYATTVAFAHPPPTIAPSEHLPGSQLDGDNSHVRRSRASPTSRPASRDLNRMSGVSTFGVSSKVRPKRDRDVETSMRSLTLY
jgi:hypothetical protein